MCRSASLYEVFEAEADPPQPVEAPCSAYERFWKIQRMSVTFQSSLIITLMQLTQVKPTVKTVKKKIKKTLKTKSKDGQKGSPKSSPKGSPKDGPKTPGSSEKDQS